MHDDRKERPPADGRQRLQAEQQQPAQHGERGGDVEAEEIAGEDVEQQAGRHAEEAQQVSGSRAQRRRPAAAAAAALRTPRREQEAADQQPGRDDAGKQRGAEFLAGNGGEALDVPEHDRAQERDQRSQDRVVDLHRLT